MNVSEAIIHLLSGGSLSQQQMRGVMMPLMSGELTDAQIAGFLIALRAKGETVDEISGAVSVMRELMTPVHAAGDHLVDIVGTGGDGAKVFNVSTASSFVAAAGGATVAKHGNRSVSSSSGAADLLEAAGVNLNLNAEQVGKCIAQAGIGFMFALNHHGAMKHAIGPRKQLGTRTVFNLLGPLTNPAGVKNQLLGVFDSAWSQPIAEVLRGLGSEHVLVVHSEDGLDEISIAAPTHVVELHNGDIRSYTIKPEDFGLDRGSLKDLAVANADESLNIIQQLLGGETGPAADMVALNAGAALYAAGVERDLASGIELAKTVLSSGNGLAKLEELASVSQQV